MLPRQGRAFHAMESSRKGDGFILFASAKRTKKQLLGRAKSCQWQVFVRRRPPKQGELRTDVSKATMFQGEREQKHAKRAAPTGANFLLVRKFSKGDAFTFFSLLRKEPKVAEGPRPSRLPVRFKTLLIMFFRDTSGSRPYTGTWCDPFFRMF